MPRPILLALGYAGAIAIVLAIVWAMQRRLLYFPSDAVPAPGEIGLSDVQPVTFGTSDGLELRAWFFGNSGSRPPVTVLVLNGNAGNRSQRAPLAAALQKEGLQVLLTDYRGFGGNDGSPTEKGLALDSRAALAYLQARPDVDRSRIVYLGESLGTGVAVDLAAEHAPAALILRSPFTSIVDVGQHHYPILPVRLLLRDRFQSIDRIRGIRVPLLVIASEQDRVVPFEYSRRLYDAAGDPKTLLVIPAAGHNDYELLAGNDMIRGILRLLQPLR